MRLPTLARLALLTLMVCQGARAQRPAPVRADGVAPRQQQFYSPGDPDLALKTRLEELMGVYLCDPPRRHDSERIHVKGRQARVDVWQPVSRLSDVELKTRAVEWLVFGRTVYAQGARGIFSALREVDDLVLVFHEVIRPDEKGRRRSRQTEQIKRYLALRLTRAHFGRLDLPTLEGCVARADCSQPFKTTFLESRLDAQYTKSARTED